VFEAAILMCSPVRGLRPVEAARLATTKLPKPMTLTSWPDFRLAVMASNVASTACPAPAFDMPVRSATAAMRSFLFISTSLSLNRAEKRIVVFDFGGDTLAKRGRWQAKTADFRDFDWNSHPRKKKRPHSGGRCS